MSRSRLIFLVIVGAALMVVLAGVLTDRFGGQSSRQGSGGGANTGTIDLNVAVSPLVKDWVDGAIQSYNGQRRRVSGRVVEIQLAVLDSLPIWSTPGNWSVTSHPLVWIPEMSAAVQYGNEVGLRFSTLQPSLASTAMMWGAPANRAQVIERQYNDLSWASVRQAIAESSWARIGGQADWGFFKIGFAQPNRYTSGMAALLIAAAEQQNSRVLTPAALSDQALISNMKPVFESVPSFATLGANPAETIAAQGASVADVALLPESEWLVNYSGLTSKVGAMAFVYPAYQFWFDFPFAVWDGSGITQEERDAAQDFLNFLMGDDQQRRAAGFGLRQSDGTPAVTTLFDRAMSAGALSGKPSGEPIQLPSTRNDLLTFVNRDWTAFSD